jgi:3-hydroxyisobutyrate dehydrogenase
MQTHVGLVGLGNAGSALALATAQELGIPLYAILASHTPYEIAEALGMSNLDYASLATLWEQWTGVQLSTQR